MEERPGGPYRERGYSEVSLKMLKSDEGQLNAVFACYGSAAQHGQFFEESLKKLIVALNELSGSEGAAEKMEKWMLGRLLQHFQNRFVKKIDEVGAGVPRRGEEAAQPS